MPRSEILNLENVSKQFFVQSGKLQVLLNLTFTISAGETVAIIGPSGSGKTTLINLCAGIDRCSSGTIRFMGQDISRLNANELARRRAAHVGIIFQNFNLIPSYTAYQNIFLATQIAGTERREAIERTKQLLARLDLEQRGDHYPRQLSGGEQQRVAIARALVNRPNIIYCDEPTGNLDDDSAQRVMDCVHECSNERGVAVIFVTHNKLLAKTCGRCFELNGGALVAARL